MPQENKCPLCGKVNANKEWYCADCGAKLPLFGDRAHTEKEVTSPSAPPLPSSSQSAPLPTPQTGQDQPWAVPLFLGIIVVMVGALGFAMFGSHGSSSPSSEPTTTQASSSNTQSGGRYSIIGRQGGPAMKVVQVEAPAGASQGELEGWAHEIESSEKESGKDFMINFHNGGLGAQNIVASYQGGSLYKTR